MESLPFDNDAHEAHIAARYERLAAIAAFDAFIDMAIDGVITMDEALKAYKDEYGIAITITPISS